MLQQHLKARLPFENKKAANLSLNHWVCNNALNLRDVGGSVVDLLTCQETAWFDSINEDKPADAIGSKQQRTIVLVTLYGVASGFAHEEFAATSFAQSCSAVPVVAVGRPLKDPTPKINSNGTLSSNPNTWFYNDVKTVGSELLWPVLPVLIAESIQGPLLDRHLLQSFRWTIEVTTSSSAMDDGQQQVSDDIDSSYSQKQVFLIRPETASSSSSEEFQIVQAAVMEKISSTATFQQLKDIYKMEMGRYLIGTLQQRDGTSKGYVFAGVNEQHEIKLLVLVWQGGDVDILEINQQSTSSSTLAEITFTSKPLSGSNVEEDQLVMRVVSILPKYYGALDGDPPVATTITTSDETTTVTDEAASTADAANLVTPPVNIQQHLETLKQQYLDLQQANSKPLEQLVLSSPILDMLGYFLDEVGKPGFICTKDINWHHSSSNSKRAAPAKVSGQKHKYFAELEDGEEEEEDEEDSDSDVAQKPDEVLLKIAAQAIHFQYNAELWPLDLAAIDCEMCSTPDGMELTRVTLLHPVHGVVLDTIVRPGKDIIDYHSEFSGITAEQLVNITVTLTDIHHLLRKMINEQTILIGHSFDNDLKVLRLFHHRVIDTAALFPHPSSLPYKHSLKKLAKEILNMDIQEGSEGHDSIQDALAAMLLVIKKIQLGDATVTAQQQQLRDLPHPNYANNNNNNSSEPRFSLFQQLHDCLQPDGINVKIYHQPPYSHRPGYERDALGYRLDVDPLHALQKVNGNSDVQSSVYESNAWQNVLQQVSDDLQITGASQQHQQLMWVSIHIDEQEASIDKIDEHQSKRVRLTDSSSSALSTAEELSQHLESIFQSLPPNSKLLILPQKEMGTLRASIARKTRKKWDQNNAHKKKQKIALPPGFKPSNDWEGQKDEVKLLDEANQVAYCNLFLRFKQ